MPETPLARLRLRQLRDLAAAFKIPIDRDAPKPEILPALIAAERQGVFKNVQNADRALLLRANWTSDDGNFPKQEIESLEVKPEPVKHIISRGGNINAVNEWREIVQRVKMVMGQDFKTHGKKKDELLTVLAEHDPEGPFNAS